MRGMWLPLAIRVPSPAGRAQAVRRFRSCNNDGAATTSIELVLASLLLDLRNEYCP